MKFITIRDFRSNVAGVRKDLETEREIVLTWNGKPFAMLTPVEPDTVEDEASAIRQARARLAIDRIRKRAKETGLDKMTMREIDELIAKVRRERRGRW